jgi:hypothetical protein
LSIRVTSVADTPRNDSVFNGTFLQVIEDLIADEMTFPGDVPDFFQIRQVEVAHASGTYLDYFVSVFVTEYTSRFKIGAAFIHSRSEPLLEHLASLPRFGQRDEARSRCAFNHPVSDAEDAIFH